MKTMEDSDGLRDTLGRVVGPLSDGDVALGVQHQRHHFYHFGLSPLGACRLGGRGSSMIYLQVYSFHIHDPTNEVE